jgi:uncharacterized protein YkwD
MTEWLKLTREDIESLYREIQATPPAPHVVRVGQEDLPSESAPIPASTRLVIDDRDLQAVSPQTSNEASLSALEQLMFGLVNQARREHLPGWLGRVQLKWHDGLAAVARGHSADMLQRQYVEHKSPEGTTPATRLERYGIRYIACGENIGVVYGENSHDARGIHDIHAAFMNQPRSLTNHRGNLLNPIWTHVGIGIAYKPGGELYVTQNYMSAGLSNSHAR